MLMRMIMNTRHMPSDSNYNIAINLIPIEFNDNKNVMEAWRGYIEQVRYKPSEAKKNEHEQMMLAKQTTMIYQMLHSLGFKLSETDIQTSAYASEGSIFRDGMYLESLHAQTRIAKTLEEQFAYVREAAGSNNGKKGTARRKT